MPIQPGTVKFDEIISVPAGIRTQDLRVKSRCSAATAQMNVSLVVCFVFSDVRCKVGTSNVMKKHIGNKLTSKILLTNYSGW
jgi:hypothetical protein